MNVIIFQAFDWSPAHHMVVKNSPIEIVVVRQVRNCSCSSGVYKVLSLVILRFFKNPISSREFLYRRKL